MTDTKKDLILNISKGHISFTFQNFWQEQSGLNGEFNKVIQSLSASVNTQEEVFARFIIYILDYCRERQINVIDKIFSEDLFNNSGSL